MPSMDLDGLSARVVCSGEFVGHDIPLPPVSDPSTFKFLMDQATGLIVASINGGAFFNLIGPAGPLLTLQQAYAAGPGIAPTVALGPVALTNAAAAIVGLMTVTQNVGVVSTALTVTAGTGLGILVTGGTGISSLGAGANSERFGAAATAAGVGATALGAAAVAAFDSSIAIGRGATPAAANTFVAGSPGNPINIVRFQSAGAGTGTVLEFMNDTVAAVSGGANEARLRYRTGAGALEVSVGGGAYAALVPGAGGSLQASYLLGAPIGITALGAVALTNATAVVASLLTVTQNVGVVSTALTVTAGTGLGILITGGTGISCPGAGGNSQRYGAGATAAGAGGLSVGTNAVASAADAVALGFGATSAFASSIGIGTGATPAAANTFVAGSAGDPINIVRFQSAGGGGLGTIYEFVADIGGAVSAGVGEARLRYRIAAGGLELSVGGGAYALLGGGVGTLQATYNAGAVIDLVGAVPVSITNTGAAAASLLTVTQLAAVANTAVIISAGAGGIAPLALQVINGRASFPMGGANSEAICLASSVGAGATSCIAVGDTAAIGAGSNLSTAIGAGATVGAGFVNCTAIGAAATVTAANGIAIGWTATAGAAGIALGNAMAATAGRFVVGPVTDVYFGNGITAAVPMACNIHATGGNAGAVNGALLSISGGLGGAAGDAGGNIDLFTGRTGTANAPTLAVRIVATTGTISCPGAGGDSQRFGIDAVAAGASATALGRRADATGARSTAVGNLVSCTVNGTDGVCVGQSNTVDSISGVAIGGSINAACINCVVVGNTASISNGGTTSAECVAIGFGAMIGNVAPSEGAIAIGRGAIVNSTYSIAIGHAAVAAFNSSIAIGDTATTTAANQLVFGSLPSPISSMYVGNGVTAGAPQTVAIRSTAGAGAVNGASLQLLPGDGGAPGQRSGSLVIGTRAAGAGGYTNQIVAAGGTGVFGRLALGSSVTSEAFGSGVEIQDTSFGCTSIVASGANPYTVLDTDFTVLYTIMGGVVTLLTPVGRKGRIICIKNRSLGAMNIATAAGLIDGGVGLVLNAPNECAVLQSDGANWFRLA